jgi:hypothetical protein
MTPDSVKASLSNEQFKLYRLVWERFMASQMASAVYDSMNVDIKVNDYLFKATGSKVKFQGFMTLYIEGRDDEGEEDESNLPELSEGEELKLKKVDPKQHFTQPPQRYTEASLVKALEEKGIGRPSTYAPTITTILSRGYVEKEKKILYPTELGKIVTDIMKNYFKDIVDIQFTAQMEDKLDSVEEGEKNFELYTINLGLPESYIKYTRYPFHFHKLLKWVYADFENRIGLCKVGWKSWAEIENNKPTESIATIDSSNFSCMNCGKRIKKGSKVRVITFISNRENSVYLHIKCKNTKS